MNPIPEKLWLAIVALQDHAERVGMRLEQIRFDLPHGSKIAGTYSTGLGPISIIGERLAPDEPEHRNDLLRLVDAAPLTPEQEQELDDYVESKG